MEDRHIALPYFNYTVGLQDAPVHSYYAVFDGHAGVEAAAYATAHLHYNIARHPDFLNDPAVAIREGFATTERNFLQRSSKEGMKSGCTAVCCLLREDSAGTKLYTGWLGDSQAMLVRQGRPVALVEPHKPDREDERKRIEELGGAVLMMGTWRVNGALAVSRALGDAEHKPYVSSDPDVSAIDLDGTEDFLVLGCDGLWDQLDPDDVAGHIYRAVGKSPGEVQGVAQGLVQRARECGSTDNITAIVVFLRDPQELSADFSRPVCTEDERTARSELSTPPVDGTPAFDGSCSELRRAANEVVMGMIETALHRVGYGIEGGYVRENGEMQTAQDIVEQVHQIHSEQLMSSVHEQFHGAVPVEDYGEAAFGENGNIGIENPGFGGNPFETRACDTAEIAQDEFAVQNGSSGAFGSAGTEVVDEFSPVCSLNPFLTPELAASLHTEAMVAEQQITEHEKLQPAAEPKSPPALEESLHGFSKASHRPESPASPDAAWSEEHEAFPADSEDFTSIIENTKQTPLPDIQEHEVQGFLTESAKFDSGPDTVQYHELAESSEHQDSDKPGFPEQSFDTLQDVQGFPASSADARHLEGISAEQQFSMMSEDLVSIDLNASAAQPLSEAVKGDIVLEDLAVPHLTEPAHDKTCHVPEPAHSVEATGYQNQFHADAIDDMEVDIAESLSPAVSADSVVENVEPPAEEPQESAVIFCELKEPPSTVVHGGESGRADGFSTSEEMVQRDDSLTPQLPLDAFSLQAVPESHQEFSEFHQEGAASQSRDDLQQYLPESDQGISPCPTSELAESQEPDMSTTEPTAETEEMSDVDVHEQPYEPNASLMQSTLIEERSLLQEAPEQEQQRQESVIGFSIAETTLEPLEPTKAESTTQAVLGLGVPKSPNSVQRERADTEAAGTECNVAEPFAASGALEDMELEPECVTQPAAVGIVEPEPTSIQPEPAPVTSAEPELTLLQPEPMPVSPAEPEPAPLQPEPAPVMPAEPEPTPLQPEPVPVTPAEPEPAPLQTEPAPVTLAEPELAVTEAEPGPEDVAEPDRAAAEVVACELMAAAETEEHKQETCSSAPQLGVQETVNLLKQPAAESEALKPAALEDSATPVHLGAIPESVPEAEGVTEDSDSEKDGGWKFVKPVAGVAAAVTAATVIATSAGEAAVLKEATSQPKASPLTKSPAPTQKRAAQSPKAPVTKASPSTPKLKLAAEKAPAKPTTAKASPKPSTRSPISPATAKPTGTFASKKPTETSTKPASAAGAPRKPISTTSRPASTLAKPSDKSMAATKPRPAAPTTLPPKTKALEVAKSSSASLDTKKAAAPLRSTVTKTVTKTTTLTSATATRTSTTTARQTTSAPATKPAPTSSRTAMLQTRKPPEAAGMAKPLTRTTASAKLNKDSTNQQLSTTKKTDSTATANRVASARMAASASQKAAAASKTLKQSAARTSTGKQSAAKQATSEGAATAIKPKRVLAQQNGVCEEKGILEQQENKVSPADVPLSNGTANEVKATEKFALGGEDIPPEV